MKKWKTKKVKDPLAGDLSDLFGKGKWVRFNDLFRLQPKNKTITIRISEDLLNEIKKLAKKEDTNYQKLIRDTLIDLILKKAS
jgi:predicted DNA binding CopG/RHH family protein